MDFEKYKSYRYFYLEVDFAANREMKTDGGLNLYMPDDEGDVYKSKPFHGKLVCAPQNSKIPLGESVYVMYQAIDTLARFDGKSYYIVTEDMIIGWGEPDNINAYKCVLIDVEKKEDKKLDFDLSEDNLIDAVINGSQKKKEPTSRATVISADNDWLESERGFTLEKGDVIDYEGGLDWEFFVNRKVRYFIKWTDRIVKRNGEMVNRYNEVKPKEKYKTVNGIVLPNNEQTYETVDGEFKGKRIFIEEKRLELGKYIKSDYIHGHI
jgi:hypothetical protein